MLESGTARAMGLAKALLVTLALSAPATWGIRKMVVREAKAYRAQQQKHDNPAERLTLVEEELPDEKAGVTAKELEGEAASRETSVPLVDAAADGDLAKVKSLVKDGADMNAKGKHGATALSEAAFHGHLAVVEFLYEKQPADMDTLDEYGFDPLISAAIMGRLDVVQFLCSKGANPNREDNVEHRTALAWARKNRHELIVKYLEEYLEVAKEAEEKEYCKKFAEDKEKNCGTPILKAQCPKLCA